MQRHKALMWRFLVLGTLLFPALALGGYFTVGGQTVLPALRVTGETTFDGTLTITTTTAPALTFSGAHSGTSVIQLPDQGMITGPSGLPANASLKVDNTVDGSWKIVGSLIQAGGWYFSSDTYDVNGGGGSGLRNRTANAGGTVAIADADGVRSVITTGPFILESDVAATGGTDYAIVMRPTATLAATDVVQEVRNAANAALFTVYYDGSAAFSGAKTRGTITLSAGSGTATVNSGAICTCTDTTANASVKCAVASTTLTATGTGTDVIAYVCL